MVDTYVEQHRIRELLEEQMVALLRAKPQDVLGFLEAWARERRTSGCILPAALATAAPTPSPERRQRRMSDNSSVTSMQSGAGNSFGSKSVHDVRPLSPFGNRGPAPMLERHALLTPPQAGAPSALQLEMPANAAESVVADEEDGSPRGGADFVNLGFSCMTPRSRNRSVISNGESSAGCDKSGISDPVTFVQCDASSPLPLRMPDSQRTTVRLDEHYHGFKRVSNDRIHATRRDNVCVSMKLTDVGGWTKVEVDEMLREVYCIINVSIQNPQIVQVLDCFLEFQAGTRQPVLYVVQERLEAPLTLKAFTEKHGLLREDQARVVLWQVIHALHFIHFHGQPHHRVHADNIYVTGLDGEGLKVKVGMFGLVPSKQRSDEEFGEDIRACGEALQVCTNPEALKGKFGELIDSMCDGADQPPTAAVIAVLSGVSPQQVLADTGIPLVSTDEVGVVLSWNGPAERLFEYDASEVVGKNISIVMRGSIKDDHARFMREYQQTHTKRQLDESSTVTCFSKSGKQLALEMRVTERTTTEFVAIFRDVSPALSIQVHNRLAVCGAQIVDYIPIACVTVDAATTNIVSFNRSAAELFGYLPAQVVGKPLTLLAPADKHFQRCMVDFDFAAPRSVLCREQSSAIFTTRLYSFEVDAADAESNSDEGSGELIRNYYIPENSISNDFNSLFTTIADSLLTGIVIIDEYGMIKRLSRFAEEVFEWLESEVLGQNVRVLMEKKFGDKHQQHIERFKKCGVSDVLGRPNLQTGLTKSGKRVKLRICVQPYYRHSLLWFVAFITPLGDVSPGLGAAAAAPQLCDDRHAPRHAHSAKKGESAAHGALGPSISTAMYVDDSDDSSDDETRPGANSVSSEGLAPPNRLSPMRRRASNLGSFLPAPQGDSVRFELDAGATH